MSTEKKNWIYDGTIEQYSDTFLTTIHGNQSCVDCHGGDDTASTRAVAHSGDWQPIPGADTCAACHSGIDATMANSLHVNLGGYVTILEDRGMDLSAGTEGAERFDTQCTKCHVANDETEPACGFCHVSVPTTAGGGLLDGHNFRKTPDMERNCTACHGSRIKDEFFGLNNELIERNNLLEGLNVPPVSPDVHFAKTQELNEDGYEVGCTFCHSGAEMHGEGHPAFGAGDRYDVTTAPMCEDCHGPGSNELGGSIADFEAVDLHTTGHLEAIDCYVCHAQPYKNCFGCHTDVVQDPADEAFGLPFYRINEGDPTLPLREHGAAGDALMTLRVGKNPRFGEPGQKEYSLLRHVPVDRDVFRYTGDLVVEGLIPNVTALPTWKHTTPHNVQSRVVGDVAAFEWFDVTACGDCHGAGYTEAWLTDPVGDAHGWVQEQYEADERAANAPVVQDVPVPTTQ